MCHFEGEVGRVGWEKLSLTLDPPRYALEKVTETRKKEDFVKHGWSTFTCFSSY